MGKAEAILPMSEQVFTDRYRVGLKLRVILSAVNTLSTGPDLVVSRVDTRLIKRLFEIEVPEIANGAVEIVAISREPGFRTKIAVRAIQDRVDPVGSCVGFRGVRIQSIVNELQGEKIDVIEWSKDPVTLITNALNPAQVVNVFMNEELIIELIKEDIWNQIKGEHEGKKIFIIQDIDINSIFLVYK